jgi:hypothetical protein
MSRANKRDTEIRAALETIGAELAMIKTAMPLVRLRMEQARQRSGLDSLLRPGLDEADDVSRSVVEIDKQIAVALMKLEL